MKAEPLLKDCIQNNLNVLIVVFDRNFNPDIEKYLAAEEGLRYSTLNINDFIKEGTFDLRGLKTSIRAIPVKETDYLLFYNYDYSKYDHVVIKNNLDSFFDKCLENGVCTVTVDYNLFDEENNLDMNDDIFDSVDVVLTSR